MQKLFEFIEHIGDWRVLVQSRDIGSGAIQSRHIAPGAITPDKIAPGTIPLDAVLKDFVLPWFDIETDENGDDYLVAYYADDGAIKDFESEETDEYIDISVIIGDDDETEQQ